MILIPLLGKIMKCLLILSSVLTLLAGAILLWWDAADGAKFSRATLDIREFSAEMHLEDPVIDPWGNCYEVTEVVATGRSRTHVFSRGPDGQSVTLGNDADDIAPWSDRWSWLAAIHAATQVGILLAIGLVGIVSSASYLVGRRRNPII